MKISRNSWHARVYSWWYREKNGHEPHGGVNLCPYVRAVLFWAHLRFLFLTKMGYVTWSMLGLGAEYGLWRLFGLDSFKLQGAVVGILAAATGIIGIGYCIWWVSTRTTEAVRSATFAQVLKVKAEAGHNKICPFMEFED